MYIRQQLVEGLRSNNYLYLKSGKPNEYRKALLQGLSGARYDTTWTGKNHSCCNSKVFWRHKKRCNPETRETGNEKWQALNNINKEELLLAYFN